MKSGEASWSAGRACDSIHGVEEHPQRRDRVREGKTTPFAKIVRWLQHEATSLRLFALPIMSHPAFLCETNSHGSSLKLTDVSLESVPDI